MTALESIMEALLFGSTWYFGILIFIALTIAIMKAWKFAGALIIPMIVALEVAYYDRIGATPEFAYPMVLLLLLVIGVAGYSILEIKK